MDDISDDEDDLGDCDNGDNRDDECGQTGFFCQVGFRDSNIGHFRTLRVAQSSSNKMFLKGFCKRHLEYFELELGKECYSHTQEIEDM